MLKNHKFLICILLAVFAIGWLLGLLLQDIRWFQYEPTFNLFELLYFICSALIAVYIAHKIERGIQDVRSQKDIIIRKMEGIDEELKEILDSISHTGKGYEIDNVDMVSQLKLVRIHVRRVHRAIEKYYPNAYQDKGLLELSFLNLRNLTTMTHRGMNSEIHCSKGIWHYSEDRYTEIRTEIAKLRDICFQDILTLNAM